MTSAAVAGVVGTTYAKPDTVVGPGDAVAFLPPVSGGAGPGPTDRPPWPRGLFELCADPLDVAELHARVGHPSCGAIVVFTGVTRETNRGQDVTRLDYEAFEGDGRPGDGPDLRRLRQGARQSAPAMELESAPCACSASIAQAPSAWASPPSSSPWRARTATPHSLAARFLIDTLKERLPVWKKEVYRGGHHWIGDRS